MDPLVCAGGRAGPRPAHRLLHPVHAPGPDARRGRGRGRRLRPAPDAAAPPTTPPGWPSARRRRPSSGPSGSADESDLAGLHGPAAAQAGPPRRHASAAGCAGCAEALGGRRPGRRRSADDREPPEPGRGLRRLHPGCRLTWWTSLAARPGVFGARMTGAGFGGCVVALCRPGAVDPAVLPTRPGGSARRTAPLPGAAESVVRPDALLPATCSRRSGRTASSDRGALPGPSPVATGRDRLRPEVRTRSTVRIGRTAAAVG